MSNKLEQNLIANKYAASILEVATQKKQGKAVREDLAQLLTLCAKDKNFIRFINTKTSDAVQMSAAVNQIAEKAKFNKLTTNLLLTLVANNRLGFLPTIINNYVELEQQKNNEVNVTATLAKKPTPAQLTGIEKSVKAAIGQKKPNIKIDIDENILGGIKIKIGSNLLDYSLRTKLENIKKHLNNNVA